MVSHPIYPGPHGAAAIINLKAPPKLKVNFLAQVATLFCIGFVSMGKPFKRRTEFLRRILIQVALAGCSPRNGFSFFHNLGSRFQFQFLTPSNKKSFRSLGRPRHAFPLT